MTRRWLALDLETSKITPPDADIQAHRPLGISCWAVAWMLSDGNTETISGCGLDDNMQPTAQLSEIDCRRFVERLQTATERGFTLLTHNGVGFDFDILAEESGMHATCAELAMNSVDTCLQIHAAKGFPVGLDAIAKGMGLQGKTEGMSGALAPELWADGQFDQVLEYVQQDARTTLEVALEIERLGYLKWVAKSGRMNRLDIPHWLTVREALALPLPDTSWMSEPLPRGRFVGWMGITA